MGEKKGQRKLGKMDNHPQGKLNDDDEGGLTYSVSVTQDKIIINFNTPVAWMGLDIDSARVLAGVLLEQISFIEKQKEKKIDG